MIRSLSRALDVARHRFLRPSPPPVESSPVTTMTALHSRPIAASAVVRVTRGARSIGPSRTLQFGCSTGDRSSRNRRSTRFGVSSPEVRYCALRPISRSR